MSLRGNQSVKSGRIRLDHLIKRNIVYSVAHVLELLDVCTSVKQSQIYLHRGESGLMMITSELDILQYL